MAEKPALAPGGDEQYRHLRDYCSRLAGDRLCRCGANMNSRYCLWSYLPPASVIADHVPPPAPATPAVKQGK